MRNSGNNTSGRRTVGKWTIGKRLVFIVGVAVFVILNAYLWIPIKPEISRNDAQLLGLTPPVRVVDSVLYLDEGTEGFVVMDGGGKEFRFCIRLFEGALGISSFYIGGTHYTLGGTQRVKKGSAQEQALIKLMNYLADTGYCRVEKWVLPLWWRYVKEYRNKDSLPEHWDRWRVREALKAFYKFDGKGSW